MIKMNVDLVSCLLPRKPYYSHQLLFLNFIFLNKRPQVVKNLASAHFGKIKKIWRESILVVHKRSYFWRELILADFCKSAKISSLKVVLKFSLIFRILIKQIAVKTQQHVDVAHC